MKYETPSTQKRAKRDPIPADIYEVELVIIKEDTRKPSQFSQGGDPVIHCGFAIVEDTEHYGIHVWKNNITPKISPPYDGGKASNLWELLSAILNKKLTAQECNDIAFVEGQVEKALLHGRLRVSVDLKEYTDHEGEKAFSNPVTKFFPAKAQGLAYSKEKADALDKVRQGKESAANRMSELPERIQKAEPLPEDGRDFGSAYNHKTDQFDY